MFYIDENMSPFFDPSPEVIERYNLTAIDEEEWNAIVEELNRPDPNPITPPTLLNTNNTIVDTNGYIKTASPVIKLFSDGTVEPVTQEAKDANISAFRVYKGRYIITGVLGTHLDEQWAISVPESLNGNPLVWVDYRVAQQGEDVNGDGSYIANMGEIVLDTYHRTYPDAPYFEKNNLWEVQDGVNEEGNPTYKYIRMFELPEGIEGRLVLEQEDVDIPSGKNQFLDIRVNIPTPTE